MHHRTTLIVAAAAAAACALAAEPNPPTWPSTVRVFSPTDTDIDAAMAAAFSKNGGHTPANHGQFSTERFAFLFKPGSYDADAPVGYYTQVLGLGKAPSDVVFTSPKGVYSEEGDYSIGGALSTFWRSAENFRTSANANWQVGTGMMWAVSQAAPLRRVVVDNDLCLFEYQPPIPAAVSQAAPLRRVVVDNDLCLFEYQPPIPAAGEASGGYFANVQVGSAVRSARRAHDDVDVNVNTNIRGSRRRLKALLGSQQQWFARNSEIDEWDGGVWNVVTTGVKGAPPTHCGLDTDADTDGTDGGGSGPFTTVASTPIVAEKPYLTIDSSGKYSLIVPAAHADTAGTSFDASDDTVVDFSQVYVASAADTAAVINAKLAAKLHVVLSPGVYNLDAPLALGSEGQVLLGLGLATLRPTAANAVVQVASGVGGVRIAGIIAQAGPLVGGKRSPALIQWGDQKADAGAGAGASASASDSAPGFLHDIFARVGGPDGGSGTDAVGADAMLVINSDNVVGDNLWLWRADHTAEGATHPGQGNDCDHGLVVNGDGVTMYGLAVEHTLKDLTVWNGNNGRTYFYQSELPYGVTQSEFCDPGYAGYRVADGVTAHGGWGIGVYSFFRDHECTAPSGIVAPAALEKSFVNPLTVKLNGNGGISHVLNQLGAAAVGNETSVQYVCP